jgi:S1-C subfamily serine protease
MENGKWKVCFRFSVPVIHAINGVQVETMAALRSALDHLAPNASVVLQIERDGRFMFVSFELD